MTEYFLPFAQPIMWHATQEEDGIDVKSNTYMVTRHDVLDLELLHLANVCAASACLAHKERMIELFENKMEDPEKFMEEQENVGAQVQVMLDVDMGSMKQKGGAALVEDRVRKNSCSQLKMMNSSKKRCETRVNSALNNPEISLIATCTLSLIHLLPLNVSTQQRSCALVRPMKRR